MGVRAMTTINVPNGNERIQQLVVMVDDVVYLLNPAGTYVRSPQSGLLPGGNDVQGAAARLWAYFVDGTPNMIYVDVGAGAGMTVGTFNAAFGEIPASPRLIAFHMDCMVLAGLVGEEQNFCMSRIGEHDDFDFAETDASAPVYGNEELGQNVGDEILALMPAGDRILNFGGASTIWRMIGHPRQGGVIVQVSDKTGIMGPNAWTSDPAGNIYFVGETGFYKMSPNGQPQSLTDKTVRQFFSSIDRATDRVTCVWDTKLGGCWIFVTLPAPDDYMAAPQTVHLFWHQELGGVWRVQFPVAMDPVAAVGFDGDSDDKRVVILGPRDGQLRKLDDAAVTDDGVVISSFVLIGPLEPGGTLREMRCTGLDFYLGEIPAGFTEEANWNVDWTLQGGRSAGEAALTPIETESGSFTTAGEQRPIGLRMGAQNFVLRLANATSDKFWAADRLIGRFVGGGKRR